MPENEEKFPGMPEHESPDKPEHELPGKPGFGEGAARTVLVTGASRGIGAAVARLFAANGWFVCLTYLNGRERADGVLAEIRRAGGSAMAVRCAVQREEDILALFRRLDGEAPPLRALINNAGITGEKTRLEHLSADMLREVCEVNLIGSILCAREAVRRMSTRGGGAGGAIVNLSSTATRLGSPNQWVHYAATKGAVEVFTNGLAREVAEEGIRVNAVSPGLTLTDPARTGEIAERLAGMRHEIPMGRAGDAVEVAEAVLFLCSEKASYITGTVLPAAGGR